MIFLFNTENKKRFLCILLFKTGLVMAPLIVPFPTEMETPSPLPTKYPVCISSEAAFTVYAPHYLCACSSFLFLFLLCFPGI